jgi:hypothetical protein
MGNLQIEKLPPMISSTVTGPLGIMHAPRLWMKLRLKKHDALADEYSFTKRGLTEFFTDALDFDFDALAAFVEREEPDYMAFEKWLVANSKNATPEAIAAFNERVRGLQMPSPRGPEWRARFGLPDSYTSAIALNDLDDWDVFHQHLRAATT